MYRRSVISSSWHPEMTKVTHPVPARWPLSWSCSQLSLPLWPLPGRLSGRAAVTSQTLTDCQSDARSFSIQLANTHKPRRVLETVGIATNKTDRLPALGKLCGGGRERWPFVFWPQALCAWGSLDCKAFLRASDSAARLPHSGLWSTLPPPTRLPSPPCLKKSPFNFLSFAVLYFSPLTIWYIYTCVSV